MIELLQAFWDEVIVRLWNHGTRIARFVIRVAILVIVFLVVTPLLIWPFVLLGVSFLDWYLDRGTWFTAVAALFPLAALLVFVIASSTILTLAYPLMSVILTAISRARSFLVWLVTAVAVAVFGEVAIGIYLAFVPVWSWPWLIAGLVALVAFLGLWLFLKWQLRWQWGGWITPFLATTIFVITVVFFFASWFGGDEAEAREEATAVQAAPREEEFVVKAGEEIDTVETGPRTRHRYLADSNWILVSAVPEGIRCPQRRPDGLCEFPMSAQGSIIGTSAVGPARVKGVAPTMTIRFERADR